MRTTLKLTLAAIFSCLFVRGAHARIVRIDLHEVPAGSELRRTLPANYALYTGVEYGELDPADAHNRPIQDLELAPRNPAGKVEYSSTFTLFVPLHPSPKAVLIYEVVNRGRSIMPRDYATGDYFLISGWQGDLSAEDKRTLERLTVPVAHNTDGTAITGPAMARWWNLQNDQQTLALRTSVTYTGEDAPPPADFSTTHAHLITRTFEDSFGATSGEKEIPSTDWHWGACGSDPGRTAICLAKGADPLLQYELRYTAKDPLVLGIGLAAVRDINAFFRYEAADTQGHANPIAGKIQRAIGLGISQSGNYLRLFLHDDMNRDEHDRLVWDGVMPIIAVRQVAMNMRFGVPGGMSQMQEFGTDGTNWWSHTSDIRGNAPDGLLDRCTASHSCPKIVEMMGSSEFYSLRASMNYVGSDGKADIPLPANVRRFYIPGTAHGGGPGGFTSQPPATSDPTCVLPLNPNPEVPIRRALLVALKDWVTNNRLPPESVYPRLAAGTLAPAATVLANFPAIPATPRPANGLNPALSYDGGPNFRAQDMTGIIATRPSPIVGITPTYLPTTDADGNEQGGIRTPLLQMPLGTYTGWNITAEGFLKGQYCNLAGAYMPFAKDKTTRLTKHDPRPSLAERYASHAAYVAGVREAAKQLETQRFLLPDDAAAMVQQAEESAVLR